MLFIYLIGTVGLLYYWLGISSVAGNYKGGKTILRLITKLPLAVFIIGLLGPLNYWMMKAFLRAQDHIMQIKDQRVKDISEILQVFRLEYLSYLCK